MNNEWGISSYPVIPGHEVIGRIVALGSSAKASRSASAWGSAGVQGASPRRRCRARANSHQRLRYHHDATERIRFAKRVATFDRADARFRNAPPHSAANRALPDRPRQRCRQALAGRQGSLPRCVGHVKRRPGTNLISRTGVKVEETFPARSVCSERCRGLPAYRDGRNAAIAWRTRKVVSIYRAAGLFQSFRLPDVHYKRGPENLNGRRVIARRAGSRWP